MTDVWSLALSVGDELAKSGRIAELREVLLSVRRHAFKADNPPWLQLLGQLLVYGNFQFESSPLRTAGNLRFGGRAYDELIEHPDATEFLSLASDIQLGAFILLEWLRSRLPGYPSLGVPQICQGAIRSQDVTLDPRWPWLAELRRLGLQLQNPPQRLLELFNCEEALLNNVRRLGAGLRKSVPVQEFARAREDLGSAGAAELLRIRAAVKRETSPEALNRAGGTFVRRQDRQRRALVAQLVGNATDSVRSLCEAFDVVDDLLEDVIGVISYRAVFGKAVEVDAPSVIVRHEGRSRRVTVRCGDERFMFAPTGIIVIPPELPSGLGDPILSRGYHSSFYPVDVQIFGRRLPGARAAVGAAASSGVLPWIGGGTQLQNRHGPDGEFTFAIGPDGTRVRARGGEFRR